MKISDVKKIIFKHIIKDTCNTDELLTRITVDSRDVDSQTVFFAVRGAHVDGHRFLSSAEKKDAPLLIGEDDYVSQKYIQVDNVKAVLNRLSAAFYDNPQNKMSFIGVTGTNGKTTVSYMIEQMLKKKLSVGVIGTVEYRYSDKKIAAVNTTPFIWSWYELLADMEKEQVTHVISEVSSHGLEQSRIDGTFFDIAVFTNFSRDHLDYHKTEKAYFDAKKLLFTKHLKDNGVAIINLDDSKGKELLEMIKHKQIKTFSMHDKQADLYVDDIQYTSKGMKISLSFNGKALKTFLPMVGIFNVYNMMASFLVASCVVDPFKVITEIEQQMIIPGRMEKVGDFGRIYIDYAHTPDALENILSSVTDMKGSGKLYVIFGAGGDRDSGKRPLMAKASEKYADVSIVTSDNPRTEDPDIIIADIEKGFSNSSKYIIIKDRKAAIIHAVKMVEENDILIVAGKGDEDYQVIGTEKTHFSDREEILKSLGEL